MTKKPKINRTTQPFRSQSDRDAMSSYFRKRSARDHALFTFGLYTGRRIGDMVRLDVGDVAYIDKRGRLCVRDRIEIVERKTGKTIDLLLHPSARRTLSRYFRQRMCDAPSKGLLLLEPLFKSRQKNRRGEQRVTQQHVWRILKKAAEHCGIEYRVGTHSLRKTFGYNLYQGGTNIELIQKLLNHSSPEVTLSYIGITRDDLDDAILAIP